MGNDEQIYRTDRVIRAHQVELRIHRQIAEVKGSKRTKCDQDADGLSVLARVFCLGREPTAIWVGAAWWLIWEPRAYLPGWGLGV